MHYIIFDLEATCWDKTQLSPPSPNETIEIGAVKIDSSGQYVSEFSQFIKPIKHPILSDFCRQLTTITQADVDNASYFYDVIVDFQQWINVDAEDYLLCSWGFYDRIQLENDCAIHHLNADWVRRHISLKHQYGDIKKLKRPVGMQTALGMEKINLEGTHHRGIDDARNIAKVFLRYINDWDIKLA
jgi:3'-5' exoribonuclease 1